MLDLSLFRKPAFAGVSAVAFALSAGMFAMFLYLTLYIQDVLGYSPLEAGVRFLPITVLSFFVAPIAGKLSARIPVRVLLGVGLALVGGGLLLMHGIEPRRRLDHAAGRLPGGGRRDRHGQPRDRLDRDRRGLAVEELGWRRGSTTPSARWASRPASRRSARSSSRRSPRSCSRAGARRAARVRRRRLLGRRPGRGCRRRPPGSRAELATAANQAFISGFNEILLVGAVVAIAGAVARLRAGALARLRRRARRPAGRRAGSRPPARRRRSVPGRC